MNLNHKELSMILAGLMRLSEDPKWFLDIMLVDIQEQMKADDLRRLIDKVVDADTIEMNKLHPETKELADKLVNGEPVSLNEIAKVRNKANK